MFMFMFQVIRDPERSGFPGFAGHENNAPERNRSGKWQGKFCGSETMPASSFFGVTGIFVWNPRRNLPLPAGTPRPMPWKAMGIEGLGRGNSGPTIGEIVMLSKRDSAQTLHLPRGATGSQHSPGGVVGR